MKRDEPYPDYERVCALYRNLLAFLTRNGTSAVSGCIPLIADTIDVLSSQISAPDKTRFLLQSYTVLFRTRGGLSDFHLWDDDFQRRIARNESLEKIRNELWRIMKPFFTDT